MTLQAREWIARREIPGLDIYILLWRSPNGTLEIEVNQGDDDTVSLYSKEDIRVLKQALDEIGGYLK